MSPADPRVGRGFRDLQTHVPYFFFFLCEGFEDWEVYLIALGSQRHVTKADLELKSLDSQSTPQYSATNTSLEYSVLSLYPLF